MDVQRNRGLVFLIAVWLIGFCEAQSLQPNYQVRISAIERSAIHKKWLFIPSKVEYTVRWEVLDVTQNQVIQDISPFQFQVRCEQEQGESIVSNMIRGESNYRFKPLPVGIMYRFTVSMFSDGRLMATSVPVEDQVGRKRESVLLPSQQRNSAPVYWFEKYLPLSGRWAYFWRPSIYDASSPVGRIVFWLLWWCFIFGLYLGWRCYRKLQFSRIFPMSKKWILFGFNANYNKRIAPEYKNFLYEWKQIIEDTNKQIKEFIKKQDMNQVPELGAASVKYWVETGSQRVRMLLEKMGKFEYHPAIRVLKAGLEVHEMAGFRWMDASREVERAIENQASSELEILKRESFFDFLWNLSTLTPLLGLLGTVTGISKSFDDLTGISDIATQKELIHQLAGGIHEALWTTIEGLIFGIVFMLMYYYYQKKLDWVYSKWEEDYVKVIEKL